MIKSVRIKLFIVFTIFLAVFLALAFLLNLKFIDRYYVYKMESTFYSLYEHINKVNSNQPEAVEDVLIYIDRFEKVGSYILHEKSSVIKYASKIMERDETRVRMISKGLADLVNNKMEEIKTGYVYAAVSFQSPSLNDNDIINSTIFDPTKKNSYYNIRNNYEEDIIFIKEMDSGEVLILVKHLDELKNGSKIASEFLLYVGIFTLILGSIFIFFYSKLITKSIVSLSKIAKSISNLDFSKKYDVQSKDEIGVLGDSINLISEELNKAMEDLMEANAKLKKDIERKKKVDKMRKDFITSISHELKSPIGITKGYVEGLKYNIANNEEKRNRYYDILIDEADKMDKMVKQLLNLSHLESEMFQLEELIFNISVLIDEVAEKYSPSMEENGIEVKVTNAADYFVKADYLRIEQVLCNYLVNAVNHVDDNKYIEVRTDVKEKKIRVSVLNSGSNIPEEDLENIWESFYKIDKARSRQYGGTGLGLSIVKSIMEHHQGEYGVINNENGVEFWFELNLIIEE